MKTQVLRSRHPKRLVTSSKRPSSHSMKDFSTMPGLISKAWITRNMVTTRVQGSRSRRCRVNVRGLQSGLRLRDAPQRIRRHCRACQRAPVTEHRDQLGQVFQLQAVIERVTEAVRPVEKRKRDQREEIKTRERMADESEQRVIAWSLDPAQRKGQPE